MKRVQLLLLLLIMGLGKLTAGAQIRLLENHMKRKLVRNGIDEIYFKVETQALNMPGQCSLMHGYASHTGKPILLLVHGHTGSAFTQYAQVLVPLSKEFDVVALDLRHHGETINDTLDYSIETQARHVFQFMQELSSLWGEAALRPIKIVGNSYGGVVSAILVEEHPELFSDFVIYDSPVGFFSFHHMDSLATAAGLPGGHDLLSPHTVEGLKARDEVAVYRKLLFPEYFSEKILERYLLPRREDQVKCIEYLIAREKIYNAKRFNWKEVHVRVIWGSDDRLIPPSVGESIVQAYGLEPMFVFEKSGHIVNMEHPKRFVDYLTEHL
jgi:pimeloyl-ACP methyl ester carboxylesterase